MEKYAQYIINILVRRNIPCFYNKDEMLVYSGCESGYGNTHSIYEFSDGVINNVTIYDRHILPSKEEGIRVYLEELNRESCGSCFLISSHIEYIVLSNQYELYGACLKPDALDFIAFCLHPHETFARYRSEFYRMTMPTQE